MLGNRAILMAAVSVVAITGVASEAYAGAFALREQSAYYQGTSFAGNATSSQSISSMFWNPATITAHDGFTSESVSTFIVPTVEINPTSAVAPATTAPSGDIGVDAWIPSSYFGYQVNDDLYLGLAINAPFGLSTKPDQSWGGQYYSRTARIFSLNANPVVGYKVNDMLSVALGVQVQYIKLNIKNALSPALGFATSPSRELKGDDIGFGFTAGVTYKPFEGTEIGLGFRSSIHHGVEGDVVMPGAFAPLSLVAGNNPVDASLNTPELVTLSFNQRVNDQFRVLGTIEWSNWSRLKAPPIVLKSNGSSIGSLALNYEDGWFFALGGEYDWNEQLTFRGGFAYEMSPVSDATRGTRLPDNDRIWASAGMTYTYNDKLSFDLGYTHIFGTDTPINIAAGHQDYQSFNGTLVADVDSSVEILSASLRYKF